MSLDKTMIWKQWIMDLMTYVIIDSFKHQIGAKDKQLDGHQLES